MSKTWADVKKGDVVELGGRQWNVAKIKAGKRKADVVVERKGREASSTVKLDERVKIVARGVGAKRGPLLDERGVPRRWATKAEHDAILAPPPMMSAGDATITAPPAKPGPDLWETPADKVERRVADLLSAHLVGISTDESAGHYVPPVNVTTVAAHLAIFHGGIPDACDNDEGRMLAAHDAQHAAALEGSPLAVNHWHTATRPKT